VLIRAVLVQCVLDAAVLIGFAALGRRSHGEDVAGTLAVAAPFLAAWLVGALLVRLQRRPASWPRALRALAVAFPLALALRAASGGGLAPAFVVVALLFLLAGLVGRRLLIPGPSGRARSRRPA
jgi:hypothetical protein